MKLFKYLPSSRLFLFAIVAFILFYASIWMFQQSYPLTANLCCAQVAAGDSVRSAAAPSATSSMSMPLNIIFSPLLFLWNIIQTFLFARPQQSSVQQGQVSAGVTTPSRYVLLNLLNSCFVIYTRCVHYCWWQTLFYLANVARLPPLPDPCAPVRLFIRQLSIYWFANIIYLFVFQSFEWQIPILIL